MAGLRDGRSLAALVLLALLALAPPLRAQGGSGAAPLPHSRWRTAGQNGTAASGAAGGQVPAPTTAGTVAPSASDTGSTPATSGTAPAPADDATAPATAAGLPDETALTHFRLATVAALASAYWWASLAATLALAWLLACLVGHFLYQPGHPGSAHGAARWALFWALLFSIFTPWPLYFFADWDWARLTLLSLLFGLLTFVLLINLVARRNRYS